MNEHLNKIKILTKNLYNEIKDESLPFNVKENVNAFYGKMMNEIKSLNSVISNYSDLERKYNDLKIQFDELNSTVEKLRSENKELKEYKDKSELMIRLGDVYKLINNQVKSLLKKKFMELKMDVQDELSDFRSKDMNGIISIRNTYLNGEYSKKEIPKFILQYEKWIQPNSEKWLLEINIKLNWNFLNWLYSMKKCRNILFHCIDDDDPDKSNIINKLNEIKIDFKQYNKNDIKYFDTYKGNLYEIIDVIKSNL